MKGSPRDLMERSLKSSLAAIRERIDAAARRAGRAADAVRIVAVTKGQDAAAVASLIALGHLDIGENYPQQLWQRAYEFAAFPVRWHLIGHLQSNKARRTYSIVNMIHSVDSLKLLGRLDGLAAEDKRPAPVCLQVNTSGEATKHGWLSEVLLADGETIAACRHVPIVGLMTMAALAGDPEQARPAFALLRQTRDRLRERTGLPLPELSMGMSNDYEVAVEEGATWVRLGTALFEGVWR